ncbi:hypothetical protein PI125_g12396 [Phytophthora idaei]|nr:hypothetical protein PI125_g12396 [Phytophthora idaei]
MVQKMELHASEFVSSAVRMEDMVYRAKLRNTNKGDEELNQALSASA